MAQTTRLNNPQFRVQYIIGCSKSLNSLLSLYMTNYFENRSTNASAESFNAKVKAFRNQFRGVSDIPKSEKLSFLAFCTPSGCSCNTLCARITRFYTDSIVVVTQKCRILIARILSYFWIRIQLIKRYWK